MCMNGHDKLENVSSATASHNKNVALATSTVVVIVVVVCRSPSREAKKADFVRSHVKVTQARNSARGQTPHRYPSLADRARRKHVVAKWGDAIDVIGVHFALGSGEPLSTRHGPSDVDYLDFAVHRPNNNLQVKSRVEKLACNEVRSHVNHIVCNPQHTIHTHTHTHTHTCVSV